VRNDERYRRESACVFVKGPGQPGVQSHQKKIDLINMILISCKYGILG